MPLYEYECAKDGRFELIRRFSDPPLKKCPTCGGKVEKMVSASAFHLKGSGWYVTDYAKKSSGGESREGKSESKSEGKDSKSESKSAEKKAESKTKDSSSTKESSGPKEAKESTPSTTTKDSSAPKGSSPT